MYLNKRIENILEIIIKSDYITVQKIAKNFGFSEKLFLKILGVETYGNKSFR